MKVVYKTMMAFGAVATSLCAQTNIDRLFTDEGYWAMSAKAAAGEFPDFKWEASADKAELKNDDIRLWNRDVDGFDMVSRANFLRELNVLVDETKDKASFTETLEEWVAVFDANLKVEHTKDAYTGKDGTKAMKYRWKQEEYYVYLTGEAKGDAFAVKLQYKPKVVTDAPASVQAEKDRYDGIYERSFYTPDYSKSFKGRIVGFDQGKETIEVQTKKSKLTVPLDKLSERDIAYYEEIKDLVIATKSLSITIKESKAKAERAGRAITVNTHFDITLFNRSAEKIDEIELEYDIYYKVDTLDGPPVLTKTNGSETVTSLFGKYRETIYTDAIPIVRESRPGVGGG
ncbi:hypothetical protein [Rubritalea tangerina]|uniref:Uncharacterized protein n=1 Tax=Rubritalea tangerina TaxID=430798 RepID=A0ABW4ZCL0_9BACT